MANDPVHARVAVRDLVTLCIVDPHMCGDAGRNNQLHIPRSRWNAEGVLVRHRVGLLADAETAGRAETQVGRRLWPVVRLVAVVVQPGTYFGPGTVADTTPVAAREIPARVPTNPTVDFVLLEIRTEVTAQREAQIARRLLHVDAYQVGIHQLNSVAVTGAAVIPVVAPDAAFATAHEPHRQREQEHQTSAYESTQHHSMIA